MDVNQISDRMRGEGLYQTANRKLNILPSHLVQLYAYTSLFEMIRPSRFVGLRKCSKHAKEGAVEAFHLSIPLRVVGCSSQMSNVTWLIELVKEFDFKLPALVVVERFADTQIGG